MVTTEAAKAAGTFMDAMKREPLSLALVVMNFALLGFVYFQSSQFNTQRADNVKIFTDVQREVQKLLSQCIIPGGPGQNDRRGEAPSVPPGNILKALNGQRPDHVEVSVQSTADNAAADGRPPHPAPAK